jgi:DNA-binding MarR family transcriptional regulator/tetratricopeptide (TPR) repeat protein
MALDGLAAALRVLLRDERLSTARAAVAAHERREPLRRRLLGELSRGRLTPTALVAQTHARQETVSRVLRALAEDGLVAVETDPDDRRRKLYALTAEGEAAFGGHLVFGAPAEPAPPPSAGEMEVFLGASLTDAVMLRRQDNRLDEALGRIRSVIREAAKAKLPALELRARRELTTTLRQAEQPRELAAELGEFARIAAGEDERFGPALAVPALAHLQYERGRRLEHLGGRTIDVRTRWLINAAGVYASLAEGGHAGDDWKARRGWALFNIADNYRELTKIGRALTVVNQAAILFSDEEDRYGLAHCLFLAGSSLRLRGDFAHARVSLEEARDIAVGDAFERLLAMTLMQLGETYRCEGHPERARDMLTESLDRATALDTTLTKAFALSALGATSFDLGDQGAALRQLADAQEQLERCSHLEGQALNLRRLAVVQRTVMTSGRGLDTRQVRSLVSRARSRYARMQSPAGIAACLVESGRLTLNTGRRTTEICRSLRELISPRGPRRDLLERDPWVPDIVLDFAREACDPTLVAAATSLRADARSRAALRESAGWAFLYERACGRVNEKGSAASSQDGDRRPDEMAGEPRRLSQPVAMAL